MSRKVWKIVEAKAREVEIAKTKREGIKKRKIKERTKERRTKEVRKSRQETKKLVPECFHK